MVPRLIPVTVALLTLAWLVTVAARATTPARATQMVGPGCRGAVEAPDDDLRSAAVGLTPSELDALYGPGEAVQDGTHYQRDGYVLISQNCDIVVTIDPDGPYAEARAAYELARSLLPQDAILVGMWALGNRGASGPMPQEAEEWISGSLAARYRLQSEPRSGSILVLYDYSGTGFNLGSVNRIELRSAQLPRVLASPAAG